jgi:HEAT repeat protein
MQRMLVAALADCQAAEATATLGRLVDGPFGEEIRARAVQALGRRRAPQSVAALLRHLDDPRTPYLWRGHAARALALTGDERAVERVVAHFESQRSFTHSDFRDQARQALGMVAADRVTRAQTVAMGPVPTRIRPGAVARPESLGRPALPSWARPVRFSA